MQYRLVVLFTGTVTAVPIVLTGGSSAILSRSEEDLIGNVGIAVNVLSNGDSTGIKNAKHAEDLSIGGIGPVEVGSPVVTAENVKRAEDVTVGGIDSVVVGTIGR
ncbi:hypothetical protein N7486_007563 [Penicillium sp. IBT 16267x]|nr:hypothetical protein N7486_007563 [Penicillium sp. IBT 16267x]